MFAASVLVFVFVFAASVPVFVFLFVFVFVFAASVRPTFVKHPLAEALRKAWVKLQN